MRLLTVQRTRACGSLLIGVLTATSVISATSPGLGLEPADVHVSTSAPASQDSAAVARDVDGDFVVVWAGNGTQLLQTDTAGVFFQRYNASGVAQGNETRVNTTTTGIQRSPAVAMDASGNFVVVWEGCNGSGTVCEVLMQRFTSAGATQGNETTVNTTTTDEQTSPAVARAAGGTYVVAWQSLNQDGSGQGIYAQRFDAAGAALGSEFIVTETTAFSQTDPAVAVDPSGNFVVTWVSGDGSGQGNGVFARQFAADGTPGSEFRANVTTAGEQIEPAVSMAADGAFAIAWQGPDADANGIFMRRYDSGGTAQTAGDDSVNATTTGDQGAPSIALDASGEITVAWAGDDADPYGIFFQRFDANGAAQGAETPANVTTTGDQAYPAVAADADGDFVIAWQSFGQDGGDYGIYLQRYSGPEDVDLSITKADSADPVANGTPYSYTLTVENHHAAVTPTGNATVDAAIGSATAISIEDILPAGVTFTGGTGTGWTCSSVGQAVTCAYGNVLAPGATAAVTLAVTAPPGGGEIDNTATVSGGQYDSVTGNDAESEITYACATPNAGSVQFSAASYTVGEDGDDAGGNDDGEVTITVTRAAGSCGTASVEVTTADGTATSGQDYAGLGSPATLSWADGDSSAKTLTIPITEELAHELDTETFNLALQNPDRVALGGQDTAVVSITDNDTPPVMTLSATGSPFSESGGTATVTATLDKPAGRAVTVSLAYAAGPGANATVTANRGTGCGTATTESDYTCSGTSITIATGGSTGSVTLTGVDDARDEDDTEAAPITATCPTPNGQSDANCTVNGAAPQVSPQVQDDDAFPVLQFSAATSSASEAQDPLNPPDFNREATLTVQLSADSDRTVTANFSVGGSATKGAAPADYTLSPDTATADPDFTFSPGQTSKTITVTLNHDTVDEPGETVIVTLADATNATLGANNPHTLTITDDDATPTVQFEPDGGIPGNPSTASVTEASANPLTVTATVQLSGASSQTVTVPFTVSGSATNPEDHNALADTLTFAPGDVEETYTYTVANDALDEASETVVLTLGTPNGATASGNTTHTATIADDPADAPVVVKVDAANSTASASETAGTASIVVQLTDGTNPKASGRMVTVPYTIGSGSSATNGSDYTLSPASPLTFAAGETSKTLTVTLINDPNNEPNSETLIVNLGTPTNGTLGTPSSHTLTITDDDDMPQVHFTDDAQSAGEGAGSATATVQLSRATNVDVTVPFSTGGTVAANDYALQCSDGLGGTQPCAGEVIVPAGQTTADVTIDLVQDARVEADETLTLTMGTPVNATKEAPDVHMLTILNDDAAGVTVAPLTADVIEGGAGDSYTLVLTSEPTNDVTINLTVGSEAAVTPGSVTFTPANWSTPKSITVVAVNDALQEGPHTDTVSHAADSLDLDYQGIAVDDVTVNITDNDVPAIALTETGGSTNVTEGGATDTYSLVLTTQPTADVVVTVTAGSQVLASPPTVTFTSADWNVPQDVTVTADNDSVAEGPHAGTVSHSVASGDGNYDGMAVRTVDVQVTDNDVAGVSITPSAGSTDVEEGGATDTYTIVLTSQPTADVTVSIASDDQVTADETSVTFDAVNWNLGRTITVTAVNDGAVEGAHSGAITHAVTSLDADYDGLAAEGIPVSITDNDSVGAGDDAPAVVVTVTGNGVNVASAEGGGGALPASSLLALLGLLALRRRRAVAPVLALCAGLALVPGLAQAQPQAPPAKQPVASGLSYQYADLRYVSADAKDPDVGASGFSLAGSWLLTPRVFMAASYAQAETDDFTVQTVDGSVKSSSLSAAVGMRRPAKNQTDFIASAGLVYAEAEGQGGFAGSNDDTGFTLEAGFRGWMAPKVEWGAALNYLAIFDDGSTALNGQVLYHVRPRFALALGAGFSDSATQFNLGARLGF